MSAAGARSYLVCYDVSNPRRLQRMGKRMEGYGVRIQYSIFMCLLDSSGMRSLKDMIARTLNGEEDSVVILPVCSRCEASREEIGPASWPDLKRTATIV